LQHPTCTDFLSATLMLRGGPSVDDC
jgi:hypothetical protein